MKPVILTLVTTLEWYEERIGMLKRLADNPGEKPEHYAEAVMVELILDGGKRARDAIVNTKGLE